MGFGTGESVCSADRSGFTGARLSPPLHPRIAAATIHISSAKAAGLRSAVKTAGPGVRTPLFREQCCNADFAFLSSVSLFDLDLYVFFLLIIFVPNSCCLFPPHSTHFRNARFRINQLQPSCQGSSCQRGAALSVAPHAKSSCGIRHYPPDFCCAKAVKGANAVRHSEILRIIRVFVCNRLQLRLGSQKQPLGRVSVGRSFLR